MLLQLVLDDDDGRAALRDHVLTIQFSFSLPEHFVNLYFSHAPVQLNVYYGVSWRIWTLTWSRCYTTGGRCCCCLIATQHIVAEAWVGWDWLRRSHNLLLRLKFALLSLLVAHYVVGAALETRRLLSEVDHKWWLAIILLILLIVCVKRLWNEKL